MPRLRAVALSLLLAAVAIPDLAAARPAASQDAGRGETPAAIRIPRALVDTAIEPRAIRGGVPQSPSGPWVVSWYQETGRLGVPGNAVMTGAFETYVIGASVFHVLDQLTPDDRIEIVGRDGNLYEYRVEWVETYPIESAPLGEIFTDETGDELLTIFTNDKPYIAETESYANVFVVRASRAAEAPTPAQDRSPAIYDAPDGCPMPPATLELPAATESFLPTRTDLDLPAAQAANDETVAELDAILAVASTCDIATRQTLALPDGSVLALVGPVGALPLDAVRSVVDEDFRPVDDTLAALCAFMYFVEEAGQWRVIQIHFLYP